MSGPPVQYTAYTPTTTENPSVLVHQISALYQNHYPNVPLTIPIASQPTTSYYNPYPAPLPAGLSRSDGFQPPQQHQQQLKQTNPAPTRPPSPSEPAVTPAIAQRTLRRLIENSLIDIGFQSADGQSLQRLEVETVACALFFSFFFLSCELFFGLDIQQLFGRAHEYANLANRAGVITPDLLQTLNDFGIEPKELYLPAKKQASHHPPPSSALVSSATSLSNPELEPETSNKSAPTSLSTPKKHRLRRRTSSPNTPVYL